MMMPRLVVLATAGLVLSGCANLSANDAASSLADDPIARNKEAASAKITAALEPAQKPVSVVSDPPAEYLTIANSASQGGVLLGKISLDAVAVTLDDQDVAIGDDGRFILGFNRDADSQAVLRATYPSGRVETRIITVNPRQWDIEQVNLPRRERTASAAFKKRRAPELAQIVAARAAQSSSQGWRQQFIWPVKGRISGRFGNQRIYRGEPGGYHTGVDVAAATGTPIVAPADGVVTLAATKTFSLEGNLLMLDHGMGLNSAFLHLSKIAVSKGDVVKKGQYIGNIGSTGSATGPHLHWSMKWNAARLDPMLLTGPMD